MPQPLRLEWWDAKDLQDNPHNWRRPPPAQEAALRQLLAEFGWAGAALYNERTKRLIDGHFAQARFEEGPKDPGLGRQLDPRAGAENPACSGSNSLDGQRGQGCPGSTARVSPVREFARSTRYCNN